MIALVRWAAWGRCMSSKAAKVRRRHLLGWPASLIASDASRKVSILGWLRLLCKKSIDKLRLGGSRLAFTEAQI